MNQDSLLCYAGRPHLHNAMEGRRGTLEGVMSMSAATTPSSQRFLVSSEPLFPFALYTADGIATHTTKELFHCILLYVDFFSRASMYKIVYRILYVFFLFYLGMKEARGALAIDSKTCF